MSNAKTVFVVSAIAGTTLEIAGMDPTVFILSGIVGFLGCFLDYFLMEKPPTENER
jgi:hypothetical protein